MKAIVTVTTLLIIGCAAKPSVTPEQFTAALNNVAVAVNNLHGRACELEARQKIERAECKAEVRK